MTVDTIDVPKLTILEELKMQFAQYSQQKEQAQNNLNQFIGAIYALEQMIKKHEGSENLGVKLDVCSETA